MKKTPFDAIHKQFGARMTDFHGWEMPVSYSGIIDEHHAVRNVVGIFDLSHMGEIEVRGRKALPFLQRLITNDLTRLHDGKILYTPVCNAGGGVIDDILVYREAEDHYFLVVNASNAEKDLNWLEEHKEDGVELVDLTGVTALIGIQGPRSADVLSPLVPDDLARLHYYNFSDTNVMNIPCRVSRTGYTGEDGFELYLESQYASSLWEMLYDKGKPFGIKPVGLGARDTLRLEMRYCLYGNELDDETTPLEAGLGWTVVFSKEDFMGKEPLLLQKTNGIKKRLVGFIMEEGAVPRKGYRIQADSRDIGVVTSGTVSPTLGKSIGMGYVEAAYAEDGTSIAIDVRGTARNARIAKGAFYQPRVYRPNCKAQSNVAAKAA